MNKKILIGVIIADCHIGFQEEILRGITAQAFKSKCDVAVIAPLNNFYSDSLHKSSEKEIFSLILSDRFDGFIYDRNTFNKENVQRYIDDYCLRSGKPVMLLDSGGHKNFETTATDDCGAFEKITDHLIDVHGYRNIFCLAGLKGTYCAEERLKGFRNSMKKHGLNCDRSSFEYGDFWIYAAQEFAEKIISGTVKRPEAVVCSNDISAIALTKALIKGGLRVPDDIAVTGYDATPDCLKISPSIASYCRPNFQLGAEAFRRLYRIITGKICSKIPDRSGEFRPAESCGCRVDPALVQKAVRRDKVNQQFENNLLYGDMLFDITNTDNIDVLFDKLDNYTHMIYKMNRFAICLTEKYMEMPSDGRIERLAFKCGDRMTMLMNKTPVIREPADGSFFSSAELLPMFSEERSHSSVYYISPLHYNDNFFGYAAVSFGKQLQSLPSLYIQWINYVNVALEQVRIKSILNCSLRQSHRAMLFDESTGLLNRSGMKNAFAKLLSHADDKSSVCCVCIELTSINKTYYRCGNEKTDRIIRSFANELKGCLHENEICGSWSSNYIVAVSCETQRAADIFRELCGRIRSTRFGDGESCDISFSIGESTAPVSSSPQLSEMIYKAAVNKTDSYTVQETSSNPQFEKLCMLRNRIMKNPELQWNISEIAESMFLSKSYLQKIYKTYFNRSIIEEMIRFRLDMAKKLLDETELTVTEISKKCGYSSYNYFVRQFRMSEGVSPSEYRENNLRNTI